MDFVRLFSLREANALVPELDRQFTRARELREKLVGLNEQLVRFGRSLEGPELNVDPKAPAEVRDLQRAAVKQIDELRSILHEVSELGIEVKAADGLADFRSRLRGRVVYLCWRYGEDRVGYWHDLDAGFAGRQPIAPDAVFEGDPLQ